MLHIESLTWMERIVRLGGSSVGQFFDLIRSDSLHLRRNRLGGLYCSERNGQYRVFRETVNTQQLVTNPVVIVVGFRLRWIHANPVFHWVFQRLCILTTPFWSGLRGFHIKLWMVNPDSKEYLGLYEWAGAQNARRYVEALVPILHAVSTPNSVWYDLYPDMSLSAYLGAHPLQAALAQPR
ncbi:MAG TPA: hypothetical protein VMV29_06720 [Ktedonobacterales bacterium]|nr:hypothetical protein [Ktedonobacterales bacterium]